MQKEQRAAAILANNECSNASTQSRTYGSTQAGTPLLQGMKKTFLALGTACLIALSPGGAHAQSYNEPYNANDLVLQHGNAGERVPAQRLFRISAQMFDQYLQNYVASLLSNPRSRAAVGTTTLALQMNIDHQVKLTNNLARINPEMIQAGRNYTAVLLQLRGKLGIYNGLANTYMLSQDLDVLLRAQGGVIGNRISSAEAVFSKAQTQGFASVAATFASGREELRASIINFEASLSRSPRSAEDVKANGEIFLHQIEIQRQLAEIMQAALPANMQDQKQLLYGYQLRLADITNHMDRYITDNNTAVFERFAESLLRFADMTEQGLRKMGEDRVMEVPQGRRY